MQTLKLDLDKKKDNVFFRGKGCKQCFNTGYSGRIGISETLMVSPAIKELIIKRAQEHVIKQKARAEGMKTLRENGLVLALKGITTLEEILKVTVADD
jgi:type II secretory ATPase GspE/PulE/Tfp pilus assembly ATPase PilB-like protein